MEDGAVLYRRAGQTRVGAIDAHDEIAVRRCEL